MRWGIAGFGWVARDFMAPGIQSAGGSLVAVCDPSSAARHEAEALGAQSFDDLGKMLGNCQLDALYIAAPNHLHADLFEQAAQARVPILCEKPLAQDLAGIERIAAASQTHSVKAGVAFDQRHHPAHDIIRQRIAAGDLGTVTAVRIVYCCWVDPDWSRGTGANWRAQPQCAGGGAVVDLAPHGLDLAQFLLGESIENLSMTLQRRVHDYPVEDGGMVMGQTASGILFSSHTSYNWPETLPRRRLEIAGTKAMIVASDTMGQDAGGHMTRIDAADGANETIGFDTVTTPFARQAAAFERFVNNDDAGFSIERDIAAARRFFTAYEAAQQCL